MISFEEYRWSSKVLSLHCYQIPFMLQSKNDFGHGLVEEDEEGNGIQWSFHRFLSKEKEDKKAREADVRGEPSKLYRMVDFKFLLKCQSYN